MHAVSQVRDNKPGAITAGATDAAVAAMDSQTSGSVAWLYVRWTTSGDSARTFIQANGRKER